MDDLSGLGDVGGAETLWTKILCRYPLQGSYHWGSGWQETPLHGTAKIPGRVCCCGEEERIAKELGDL